MRQGSGGTETGLAPSLWGLKLSAHPAFWVNTRQEHNVSMALAEKVCGQHFHLLFLGAQLEAGFPARWPCEWKQGSSQGAGR